MAQTLVLLVVLVMISLVNAKGNYDNRSYKTSSNNLKYIKQN